MQVRRCTNARCLRPYRIRKNENLSGEIRSGNLNCPHCDHLEALWEGEAFSLQALTTEQEAVFCKRGFNGFLFVRRGLPKRQPVAVQATHIGILLARPFLQARFLHARKNHSL